jgi:Putative transposase
MTPSEHRKQERPEATIRMEGPTSSTSRFMLHILPKGFHRIRHYGLFASTRRGANLGQLRELPGLAPPQENAKPVQQTPATEETVLPPCSRCGGRMTVIEVFERGTQPRYEPAAAAIIWFDTS